MVCAARPTAPAVALATCLRRSGRALLFPLGRTRTHHVLPQLAPMLPARRGPAVARARVGSPRQRPSAHLEAARTGSERSRASARVTVRAVARVRSRAYRTVAALEDARQRVVIWSLVLAGTTAMWPLTASYGKRLALCAGPRFSAKQGLIVSTASAAGRRHVRSA
jgi:hypothetical protein